MCTRLQAAMRLRARQSIVKGHRLWSKCWVALPSSQKNVSLVADLIYHYIVFVLHFSDLFVLISEYVEHAIQDLWEIYQQVDVGY